VNFWVIPGQRKVYHETWRWVHQQSTPADISRLHGRCSTTNKTWKLESTSSLPTAV